MNRYQNRQTIMRLVARGQKCYICDGDITPADLQWNEFKQLANATSTLKDSVGKRNLHNLKVRHRMCKASAQGVEEGNILEKLVELWSSRDPKYAICHNCNSMFEEGTTDVFEDLALLNIGNATYIVHKVCPRHAIEVEEQTGDTI